MATGIFKIEREGNTLIVTPTGNLRELDFPGIEGSSKEVLQALQDGGSKNLILDFKNTDYYGSTALGFFVKLWKRVSQNNGKLVFCNVSPHEREVLMATKLDQLWPICGTLDEARKLV